MLISKVSIFAVDIFGQHLNSLHVVVDLLSHKQSRLWRVENRAICVLVILEVLADLLYQLEYGLRYDVPLEALRRDVTSLASTSCHGTYPSSPSSSVNPILTMLLIGLDTIWN